VDDLRGVELRNNSAHRINSAIVDELTIKFVGVKADNCANSAIIGENSSSPARIRTGIRS
jgi:hypothetical protein